LAFTRLITGTIQRPVILVDWSDLNAYKRHYLLRASVAMDGHSLSPTALSLHALQGQT
jgi:hypothetical protein